jgi:hypothetical protein
MATMKNGASSLFLNGVYESVLEEILKSQQAEQGEVFYLQPYSGKIITLLRDKSPSVASTLPLYMSITTNLKQICYVADIVGWANKLDMKPIYKKQIEKRLNLCQPGENGLFNKGEGTCINLISIINLKKLEIPLPVSLAIKKDGTPYKGRTMSGGWSYVRPIDFSTIKVFATEKEFIAEFHRQIEHSYSDSDAARLERLRKAPKEPEKTTLLTTGFKRNPDVVAQVLHQAKGICQLCHKEAPFFRLFDGTPYLEVHHWKPLADGGEDSLENAEALCPNCHKEAHFGQRKEEIQNSKVN